MSTISTLEIGSELAEVITPLEDPYRRWAQPVAGDYEDDNEDDDYYDFDPDDDDEIDDEIDDDFDDDDEIVDDGDDDEDL